MRVALKISGEALKEETPISSMMLENIYNDIKHILNLNHKVILVCGGGNFWRGRNKLDIDSVISDQIGMLATNMNALAINNYLNNKGISSNVYSAFLVEGFIKKYEKEEALKDLENNKVIVLGGGLGKRHISTDLTIVQRAEELEADIIIMAKNIDGVYDKNPKEKDARKYDVISHKEMLDNQIKVGKDKQGVMDYPAMELLCKTKTTVYLYDAKNENGIIDIFNGNNPGTKIETK